MPNGKHLLLLYFSGAGSFLYGIEIEEVKALEEELVIREDPTGTTPEYRELFENVMEEKGLVMPATVDEAEHLYGVLVDTLTHLFQ